MTVIPVAAIMKSIRISNPCPSCKGTGRTLFKMPEDGKPSCLMATCMDCLGTGSDALRQLATNLREAKEAGNKGIKS